MSICKICGMVADVDPFFHEERYGHTPEWDIAPPDVDQLMAAYEPWALNPGDIHQTRTRLAQLIAEGPQRAASSEWTIHLVEVYGLQRPGGFYLLDSHDLSRLIDRDTDFVSVLHEWRPGRTGTDRTEEVDTTN